MSNPTYVGVVDVVEKSVDEEPSSTSVEVDSSSPVPPLSSLLNEMLSSLAADEDWQQHFSECEKFVISQAMSHLELGKPKQNITPIQGTHFVLSLIHI